MGASIIASNEWLGIIFIRMSWIPYTYYVLGIIGLIAGMIVVSALNPIHRIALLILVFMVGAFIFMLLDYYFLGLTYIIVYVGAIAILFLFVIMMVQVHFMPYESTSNTPLLSYLINTHSTVINTDNIESGKGNTALYLTESLMNEDNSYSSLSYSPITLSWSMESSLNINNSETTALIPTIAPLSLTSFTSGWFIWSIYIILGMITLSGLIYNESSSYTMTYFWPSWAIEFKTLTDLETLALGVYVAYPTALLLISIALWVVMIGVIEICSPKSYNI